MAGHGGAVLPGAQRAHVGRELVRQHRHDQIGEIDAVAALARLAVERAAGADIIADIGDRDDRLEAAFIGRVFVRRGPDGVVMVAGVDRVDRDDRQMAQILALVLMQWQLRRGNRFFLHRFGEDMRDAMLVDRDQAEAARGEGIAQNVGDARADPRRAAGRLGQDQVALLRGADVADRRILADALVDRAQPQLAVGHFLDHAEQHLGRLGELLHRMGEPALARFLGAGKDAVTDRQRAALAPLYHADARRGLAFGLPAFGGGDQGGVVDIDDAQHRHLGHAAHLVEGAGRADVE